MRTKEDNIKLKKTKDGLYTWDISINGDLEENVEKLKEIDTKLSKEFKTEALD